MTKTLAALALLATVAACGGSTDAATEKPAPPKTFTVTGQVFALATCDQAALGYQIDEGTQVVVSNPADVKVAVGALRAGRDNRIGACSLPFSITGIPDKYPLLSIAVGDQAAQTFTRAELRKPVTLSAG